MVSVRHEADKVSALNFLMKQFNFLDPHFLITK